MEDAKASNHILDKLHQSMPYLTDNVLLSYAPSSVKVSFTFSCKGDIGALLFTLKELMIVS